MQVNELKEISDQYRDILRLDGTPVAVKLFKEPIELKGIVAKKLDQYRRHLCQLISKTWYVGRTNFKNPVEVGQTSGLGCALGVALFGWRKLTAENARKYFGTYFKTEEHAQWVVNAIPRFEEKEYASILIAPLEDCPVIPDVVVFQGNVGQMIAILRGYFHNKKEGLTFDTTSLAACADAIIAQSVDVRYS